jgi:hypothetical protein
MKLKLALVCAIGLASVNAMACYTVYDRNNNVVYNAQTAPVDMSRPLHETVPAAFPGGTMVFDASTSDCPREMPAKVALPATPAKPSPLLTDRRTAAAMKAPHTILPSGVALISQPTPMMTAGLSTYSTSSPAPVVAPAVVAQRSAAKRDTVITELHNPPLTVVQQGGMVVSELR